jgi:transketolase
MALAPAAYVLWMEHLRYNPVNPLWFNRDRFILSNGHASMLQYAILHLVGYKISLDDLKNFRQWDSITPGHPERGLTPGVEITTGPLGQGLMNAVGMAIAEAHLAALFNTEKHPIVNHYTYVFCSDGDLMEGASHEAASIAGHFGLGKLIVLYDDNHITIEGNTSLTYSDDVAKRFESYHWHVQNLGDKGNDIQAISESFTRAKSVTDQPSLIILRTHIGYGSPHKQDTPEAHGSPLGDDEVKLVKKFYGWPEDKYFWVPDEVKDHMKKAIDKGKELEDKWEKTFEEYKNAQPELAKRFSESMQQDLPDNWDKDLPLFQPKDGPKATREVSSDFLNGVAAHLPWLMGGSADLEPSTKTRMDVRFGDQLQFNGYTITQKSPAPSKPLDLKLFWSAATVPGLDLLPGPFCEIPATAIARATAEGGRYVIEIGMVDRLELPCSRRAFHEAVTAMEAVNRAAGV